MTDAAENTSILTDGVHFSAKTFSQLTTTELKQIYQLRQQVFIVEQNCPYPDIDEADETAWHLLHRGRQAIDAYARIINQDDDAFHIGRVVVAQCQRQQGLGRILMKAAIQFCQKPTPKRPIIISAQSYLARFYEELGFQATGHYYLEDDIPHMRMLLPVKI